MFTDILQLLVHSPECILGDKSLCTFPIVHYLLHPLRTGEIYMDNLFIFSKIYIYPCIYSFYLFALLKMDSVICLRMDNGESSRKILSLYPYRSIFSTVFFMSLSCFIYKKACFGSFS
jgi:hypothetical protein